jgi:uncharacterized radical SAM superfamily Fe-S cluster-containing enzyme
MNDGRIRRETYSLCPQCGAQIPARHVERGGAVYLEKNCPAHGDFSAPIWRGYEDIDAWRRGQAPLSLAPDDDCPNACGLCANHQSGTCCVLLEVTKRCNLRCPYCFAHGGAGEDRPLEDVVADIRALAVSGQTLLQLSGGEPTVRDDLPTIVAEAKRAGCRYVQLNTNGVRLASDKAYLQALKDAGLSFVFMQFDGMDDEVYRALRGQALLDIKMRAIENCGALGIGVTLVPTLVPGVNTHHIGDILRFAASKSPEVRGVHFQPVSYFGRTPKAPDDAMRYTLDQLLHDIKTQASEVLPPDSLLPSRCDHPLCGFHGDYVVLPDATLYSLATRDAKRETVATAAQNRAFVARRWDRSRSMPNEGEPQSADPLEQGEVCCCEGVSRAYERPMEQGCCEANGEAQDSCCCGDGAGAYERPADAAAVDLADMDVFLRRVRTHGFTVTAMAFQDAYTIDLERLKRCSLHVYTQGKFIPFCRYYL